MMMYFLDNKETSQKATKEKSVQILKAGKKPSPKEKAL